MLALRKAVSWIEARIVVNAEKFALYILISAAFGLTFLQVVLRYLFDSPLVWTDELVRYLFVWIVMVGAGASIRFDGHFALTALVATLSDKWKRLLAVGVDLTVAAFALLLLVQGINMTLGGASEEASSLPFRMLWFYLAIPVGGGLMLWHLLARAIGDRKLLATGNGTPTLLQE